ncbi:hypothetical protein HJFPF1_00446 [Paramyrothecium foliicola]|nr:hypothetical protein HJFPF1_00446 [Paramyrothecium foliicola]
MEDDFSSDGLIRSSASARYTLASDKDTIALHRDGDWFHEEDIQTSVVIPKPHTLLEAFLRLYARDSLIKKDGGSRLFQGISWAVIYIDEEEKLLDTSQLPGPLRTLYNEFRNNRYKTHRDWLDKLNTACGYELVELIEDESTSSDSSEDDSS